jgi:CubicO group peptidase (beta-lactamase class C family)
MTVDTRSRSRLENRRGAGLRALLRPLVVACALVAAGGGVAAAQSPSATPAVPVSPAQIDAAIAQLDGIAQEQMQETGVPGMAIAVVHGDRVVYARGFGVRKAGTSEPVDADTVFQLASVSKPVGATIVARAVGEGQVDWDDPIVKHLPGFRLSDPDATRQVTLADMYAHRSGLPPFIGDILEDLGFGRRDVLRRLRFVPLSPLRAGYAYTNFGLTTAALAAARAAGMSWESLAEETLYQPLGMSSTSSRFTDFENRANRAVGHVKEGDQWVARFQRDPDAQTPAAGVSSSVSDMAKWLRMVLAGGGLDGRRIVGADALTQALTPVTVAGPPSSVDSRALLTGMGIDISTDATGRVRYTHSGAFRLGAATNIAWVPNLDLGIVTLTNSSPVGLAEAVNATFLDVVEQGRSQFDWLDLYGGLFESLLDNPSRLAGKQPPADPDAPRPARAYAGTYRSDFYGLLVITATSDELTMRLGPAGREQSFQLSHFDGDTFSYEPRGESATGISAVSFRGGTSSGPRKVNVEFLDDSGLGDFTKTPRE